MELDITVSMAVFLDTTATDNVKSATQFQAGGVGKRVTTIRLSNENVFDVRRIELCDREAPQGLD